MPEQMPEQTPSQDTSEIELSAIEAGALNLYYGTKQEDVESRRPGFLKKTAAALMVMPSLVLGRSGCLKRAQEYAKNGVAFNKGVNLIKINSSVEKSLLSTEKHMAYMSVVGLIFTIPSFSLVAQEMLKRPDDDPYKLALRACFMGFSGTVLYYGAQTWRGLELKRLERQRYKDKVD